MERVLVTENVAGADTMYFLVSNRQAKLIDNLYQNFGGFRRFNFAIYDDGIISGKNQFGDFCKWFYYITGHKI